MDFISSVTQAATQASIASERVRHVVRVFDRNRSASQNTVDTLTKLATGNLTSAADLLRGATSMLSVAGDLSPQIGTVMRSFSATGAAVSGIVKMIGGVNHPLIQSAAQSVMGALGDTKTRFTALVGEQTAGALQSFAQTTGLSSVLSGLFDSATSSTPHLLTLSTDDGDAFHFGLSTAAFDKLRRSTRFKIASQERLNREEAQQPVSQGGDTITLSGVVFSVARCRFPPVGNAARDRREAEAGATDGWHGRRARALVSAQRRRRAGGADVGRCTAQANLHPGVWPLWRRFCEPLTGDILDTLCYAHYGTLKGTVEAVYEANPGLARELQPFRSAC